MGHRTPHPSYLPTLRSKISSYRFMEPTLVYYFYSVISRISRANDGIAICTICFFEHTYCIHVVLGYGGHHSSCRTSRSPARFESSSLVVLSTSSWYEEEESSSSSNGSSYSSKSMASSSESMMDRSSSVKKSRNHLRKVETRVYTPGFPRRAQPVVVTAMYHPNPLALTLAPTNDTHQYRPIECSHHQ